MARRKKSTQKRSSKIKQKEQIKEKEFLEEYRTLNQQIDKIFSDMYAKGYGISRNDLKTKISETAGQDEDKKLLMENETREIITATSTFTGYKKKAKFFAKWLTKNYPEINDIRQAKDKADEFLKTYKVATTRKGYASALAKLYQIPSYDLTDTSNLKRKRKDIKNNRDFDLTKKGQIDLEKNKEFIKFLAKTGLRHSEVNKLKKNDYKIDEKNDKMYIYVHRSKGGKSRYVEVLGDYKPILQRMQNNAGHGDYVWPKNFKGNLTKGLAQTCRRIYANAHYLENARDLDTLDKKEKIYLRKERLGDVYDREKILNTSEMLGHGREDVITTSYMGSKDDMPMIVDLINTWID